MLVKCISVISKTGLYLKDKKKCLLCRLTLLKVLYDMKVWRLVWFCTCVQFWGSWCILEYFHFVSATLNLCSNTEEYFVYNWPTICNTLAVIVTFKIKYLHNIA